MSAVGERVGTLPRPYTLGTFQKRLNDFSDLMKELTLQDMEATPEERRQLITENLRFDQFCESIRSLFGSDIRNQDLKALYRKISTNPDAKVDWSELFGFFQSETDETDLTLGGEEVSVFTVSKRLRVGEAAGDKKRRDIIQSIRIIPALDGYLAASQKGAICIWSSKLRLQTCVDINESAWVTGCDYLRSMRRVIVSTERSLSIWDNRAKVKNQHVFTIKPLEHSPQCVCWVPNSNSHLEDTVLFGDDQGFVNMLTLAAKDLTPKNAKGDAKLKERENIAIDPQKLTHPIIRRRLHDDWVIKIEYIPELRCFASCSPSSNVSFVLEEVEGLTDNRNIRGVGITKGCNAFAFCARANIIATGGVDKIVRVWHPHIFSRPTGKLIGHLFTISDIVCNEKDQHIISLSTARVFRVWDIHTLTSLQVFTDNEERPGERRIFSVVFDQKHDRLMSGSSVLDSWPLTRAVQDTMQVPHTHDRPVLQVLYNKELNQVISVCSESMLKVWEMETGKFVYQIAEPHGTSIEIVALALDSSGYRLATGGSDGSMKVWDFGAGQEIKEKSGKGPDQEEFTLVEIQYCTVEEKRCIVAIGWKNRIRILLDANDGHDLPILREFTDIYYWTQDVSLSPAQDPFNNTNPLPKIGYSNASANLTNVFRKEYVLTTNDLTCLSVQEPATVVTGSATGNLIFWDLTKGMVNNIVQTPEPRPETTKSRHRNKQLNETQIHKCLVLVHKTRKLDPAYIQKLIDDENSELNSPDVIDGVEKTEEANLSGSQAPSRAQSQAASQPATVRDDVTIKGTEDDDEKEKADQSTEKDEAKDDITLINVESVKKSPAEDDDSIFTDNPEKNMIVESYDPVIVTCHQDAMIRFWDAQGQLLREIMAMTRRQGSPVTSLCSDTDCNYLVSGDTKGYIVLWEVGKFLEDPYSEDKNLITQVISWRAHLTKVVTLNYVDNLNAIISGSMDGSVRVWWGTKGRFVGFFGQYRPFHFQTNEETAGTPILPYDISEGPLGPVKRQSASQKIKNARKMDYPLVFDEFRWKPFRRSAYFDPVQQAKKQQPEDKKFFGALIKPRLRNNHLESFTTAEARMGGVFRALPVYRVRTPAKPKTPDITFLPRSNEADTKLPSYLLPGNKVGNKKGSQTDRGPMRKNSKMSSMPSTLTLSSISSPRRR
ncbi:WD repeat-containing protein 64-like isoform X2 [Lineus longissimus]|uniref:WD repeat-containing protein 64-like isoform X2 n=1 Tax=Lineus longissimus TaxID=88925 RepID=UPI002B4D9CFA